jgi:nucleotide-binding universal stress UspA family protein
MPKRVLVPLDQTVEAEGVLAVVADLVKGGEALLRLLHVAPVPDNIVSDGRIVAYADQEGARLQAEGEDYLRAIEARLGLPVEVAVRFGDAVPEILRESEAFGADLIVMSTASASGLSRLLLGSVAEQVLRRAPVPVVLYRGARHPDS